MSHLNFSKDPNTIRSAHTSQQQYSPLIQSGIVAEQHQVYAAYSHIDRANVAKELKFDLQLPSSASSVNTKLFRINAKSYVITSFTDVSKELVLDEIKQRFNIDNVQYICVSEELSEVNHQRPLHIQVILKNKVNLKSRFLDKITGTLYNYQGTRNDLAWKGYIKKDSHYLECNEFKSTHKTSKETSSSLNDN